MIITAEKTYPDLFRSCERNNKALYTYVYTNKLDVFLVEPDLSLSSVGKINSHAKLSYNSLSFHASEPTAAFLTQEGHLSLGDFAGNIVWENKEAFVCVMFARNGVLWATQRIDKKTITLCAFDVAGRVLASHQMADNLYDSSIRFGDIPGSDEITMEFAAGQDGICVYRVSLDAAGQIGISEMFPNACYISPAWQPNDSYMFSLENDDQRYAHFTAQAKLLAEQEEAEYDDDEEAEDHQPGYEMLYLSDGRAIVQNTNERFFLFDIQSMKRGEELVFNGYEPLPAYRVFKNLKDDASPFSILSSFRRLGNILVATTGTYSPQKATLLIYEHDLIQQLG